MTAIRQMPTREEKDDGSTERKEQQLNARRGHWITYQGRTLNIKEWAKHMNISYAALMYRIHRGWSIEDALTMPNKRQRALEDE